MNAMNWIVVYPELVLLAMACVITLVDLWVTDPRRRTTLWLTQATLGYVAVMHLMYFDAGFNMIGMQAMVVADPLGHLLAAFAAIATMATVAYAQPYLAARDMLKGEFFTLALFVYLGISVMVSANNYAKAYADALIFGTPPDQLVDSSKRKMVKGMSHDDIARMEKEMEALERDYKFHQEQFGENSLHLNAAQRYVKRLLENSKIKRFLAQRYSELLDEFQELAALESL